MMRLFGEMADIKEMGCFWNGEHQRGDTSTLVGEGLLER